METHFVWQEDFNIGVDVIDKEHKRLFKIINKLFEFKDEKKTSQFACQEGIKFFKGHAIKHFADEEAYMESIHYEGFEQHRHIHTGFRENTLPALEQELEQTGYAPDAIEHFLGVCAGWLIGHTLTEDLAITGKHHLRKWTNLLPGEELAAVKQVIVRLVYDMFHLEPQLISDAYHGEKFGDGVYYRLIYGTKRNEKKQEVIMVFEEKLLINSVGKILGFQPKRLDNTLVHASRYTVQQFVERVMEYFPIADEYELKSENLLSYEQFHKICEKEKFHVSLLFNTGSGYFSYCAIAPHLLEGNIGTPLVEGDNALNEVKKYLMKRENQRKEPAKPKILVVDDSATIRQHMEELLGKDYDVALAESGVAAIRMISLNRPDLVLLDYEMPVCDGKQTLEMLRSEKAFADLPVIFLTGKSDAESVKKVRSLKPAGYLLKYLQPVEIKNNIDTFFTKQKA